MCSLSDIETKFFIYYSNFETGNNTILNSAGETYLNDIGFYGMGGETS